MFFKNAAVGIEKTSTSIFQCNFYSAAVGALYLTAVGLHPVKLMLTFEFPIYVDKAGLFKSLNPHLKKWVY
jgi:hypothetical protein